MNPQLKPRRIVDRKYREFVKAQGCVIIPWATKYHQACSSIDIIDAHHVKPEGGGIMGSKVSDYRCVGLCRLHHQMVENFPVTYRDILEAAIRRLNKEYFALFPPKEKRERQASARVQHLLILCECQKVHKLTPNRLSTITEAEISYWCPFKKCWLSAGFRKTG